MDRPSDSSILGGIDSCSSVLPELNDEIWTGQKRRHSWMKDSSGSSEQEVRTTLLARPGPMLELKHLVFEHISTRRSWCAVLY